jgi:hypothetical protein
MDHSRLHHSQNINRQANDRPPGNLDIRDPFSFGRPPEGTNPY